MGESPALSRTWQRISTCAWGSTINLLAPAEGDDGRLVATMLSTSIVRPLMDGLVVG